MDTIYALSTSPGKAGIAVIRVSGPMAAASPALWRAGLPSPRRASLQPLYLADGSPLDHALILYFAAPHSFTGEEVVEYHVHGSVMIIRQMLSALSALPDSRMAEPGEFTRRAFLNGKMDLTGAEGLADLIDAQTPAQHRQAIRAMQGDAARFFEKLRGDIIHVLAYLEAYIDFPDEDIPSQVLEEIASEARAIEQAIAAQLAGSGKARRIRDGIHIAIIGPPNAGKSTLLNYLAGRDAAIVSHIAGTTRDVIEVHLDIAGFAVVLADTAGIREHKDEIEGEGIRRSFERAESADLKILLTEPGYVPQESLLSEVVDDRCLIVMNKCELLPHPSDDHFRATPCCPSPESGNLPGNIHNPIRISLQQNIGLDHFMRHLESRLLAAHPGEASFVTRSRHETHLTNALTHLGRFSGAGALGLELQCEELRRAAVEIGKITGKIDVDELLGHIFSSFCIGK